MRFFKKKEILASAVADWRRRGLLDDTTAENLFTDIGPVASNSYWKRLLGFCCIALLLCGIALFCNLSEVQKYFGRLSPRFLLLAFGLVGIGFLFVGKKFQRKIFRAGSGVCACVCFTIAGVCLTQMNFVAWFATLASGIACLFVPGAIPAYFSTALFIATSMDSLSRHLPEYVSCMIAVVPLVAGALLRPQMRRFLHPALLAYIVATFFSILYDKPLGGCIALGFAVFNGLMLYWSGIKNIDMAQRLWGIILILSGFIAICVRNVDENNAVLVGFLLLMSLACGIGAHRLANKKENEELHEN